MMFKKVQEFMKAADMPVYVNDPDAIELCANLIEEEYIEWMQEIPGTPEDLKECVDMLYVIAQYMNLVYGPKASQIAFDRVHENNMSKCVNGVLIKREDGKVLKPEGYKKVTLNDLVPDDLKELTEGAYA